MKKIATLEIQSTLIDYCTELDRGVIVKLGNNLTIFMAGSRIGLFDQSTIDEVDNDFSKIPISSIDLMELEDFSYDSGASISGSTLFN